MKPTQQELTLRRDRLRDEIRRLTQEAEEAKLALFEVLEALKEYTPEDKD